MKRGIALLMALVMCLSLCACGGGSESSPETKLDVENAIAETPKHIYKDVEANQAKAMQNIYMMNCTVGTITDTYFECSNVGGLGDLRICLPLEELAELEKGSDVAIVGKITEVEREPLEHGAYETHIILGQAQIYDGVVPEVAPREDEIYTGTLRGKSSQGDGSWYIQFGNSNILKLIYFAEGEDLSAFNEELTSDGGDEIRFTADTLGHSYDPSKYINAKIVD